MANYSPPYQYKGALNGNPFSFKQSQPLFAEAQSEYEDSMCRNEYAAGYNANHSYFPGFTNFLLKDDRPFNFYFLSLSLLMDSSKVQ